MDQQSEQPPRYELRHFHASPQKRPQHKLGKSELSVHLQQYHCSGWAARKHGKRCAHAKYYREEKLEKKISAFLKNITIPQEFAEWGLEVLRENYDQEIEVYQASRTTQQRTLNAARQKLANLLELKISPRNQDGSLLTDEQYLMRKKELEKEIADIAEQLSNTNQNETNWINDCEQFFDFSRELQEQFAQGKTEEQRTLLQNLGKILLNRGKLAFRVEEPYSFLEKAVTAYKQESLSSEPKKGQSKTGDSPIFVPKCSRWWARPFYPENPLQCKSKFHSDL